ncbi:T9SS type B sorting domain-containing protein [Mucilaginibacter koreensis]
MYPLAVFLLFLPWLLKAEGSKELTANGGNRAYLLSSPNANSSFPFPTRGTMKVYAKAGETIYVGSSAQGIGSGTINLRAPDGAYYTSGTSTTVGVIANRSQEAAGPMPNSGGYRPFTQTVLPSQEGIWEVDFIPPTGGTDFGGNPTPVTAGANWSQAYSQYVTAFDVSVRNAANNSFLTGRVFTNVLSGILGTFDVGFNAILYILTKDGYQYTLDNNGQAGNGFTFFANNKGLRNADGSPAYSSLNRTTNPNVQDPRSADTPSDITHKIFFNAPAADMPTAANTAGGGSTWLLNLPVEPTLSNVSFTGTEGTPGKGGTAPLGGNIAFTATANGTYVVGIDVNKNGLFTDAVDRRLTGTVNAGINQVNWDGLDGTGNKVPASVTSYTASVTVSLFAAEVHFPFFDVERNVNGIKLTRINGALAPDNTIYWNDSPVTIVGVPSNPITNLTGISSLVNGHKWGRPSSADDDVDFGNNRSIDTWAYATEPPLTGTVNFVLQEADLEISNLTTAIDCATRKITYAVTVKNNGPADVTGGKFSFTFPNGLTRIAVTSANTSGASAVQAEATTATQYSATLNIANGSTRTFTITGNADGNVGNTTNIMAFLLRPADVTDPGATNADAAAPVDAAAECNASSTNSCNNIKTGTTVIVQAPDAGPDQSVVLNTTVNLTASSAGTWSQVGSTPVLASIATPNGASTTVTGLTTAGAYQFMFTNSNGCTDVVTVSVFSADTAIPNIITPNGDGKNDVLEIENIGFYPNSQLLIFNRWGNEVYRSENYNNTWNGSGLADGTYYYLFNRKEATGKITPFKGWIYLKR